MDLSQPGWLVKQGQAVWKPDRSAPELSGELVWAAHRDGRFLLQFMKTPITLVEARGTEDDWSISFPARRRTLAGRASLRAPERLGWIHLTRALQGKELDGDWAFVGTDNGRQDRWTLGNARTGEMIEGYLHP